MTEKEVLEIIQSLTSGKLRVCEKINGTYTTHAWIKEAILKYFQLQQISPWQAGEFSFQDKIPLQKFTPQQKVRVVPPATVRFGAYVGPQCVLMPSFVNIGAYVDEACMLDTWSTVGSCAQIGKRVHLSGGVGIGGVLEPAQAQPVILEDDVFVGSRAVIVEGVVVEEKAVIGAGVILTASTKIVDVTGSEEKILTGRIPARSVVIPGTRIKGFEAGEYGVPCALIVGERKASTDEKTALNQTLREFSVPI